MKILLILLLAWSSAQAQGWRVSGNVLDAVSKEPLPGASVTAVGQAGAVVATDARGVFTLRLPAGPTTLQVRYLGYFTRELTLSLRRDETLTVLVVPADNLLPEVTVRAGSNGERVQSTQVGVEKIDRKTALQIPVVFGEIDVIKVLQLKPGVKSTGEGTSGISVRGGSTDQNLFQYDGTTVYNPSHLFGFFSTFNIDAVQDVSLYKAGFPAEYSGRLSSVVAVTSRNPSDSGLHVGGGIGLIASRLNVSGPLFKDKLRFNLAARRTYADVFTELINRRNNDNPDRNPIPRYFFYDLNGRVDWTVSPQSRVFLSGYYGRDRFSFPTNTFSSTFDWGNTALSLHWEWHSKNGRLRSHTSGHYAGYDYRLLSDFDRFTFNVGSGIRDFQLKQRFGWRLGPVHALQFGGELTRSRFDISRVNISSVQPDENINSGEKPRVWEGGAFVSDEWSPTPQLKFSLGLRLSGFSQDSVARLALEPRLAVRYALRPNLSLKASYSRMVQYRHLVVSSGASLPTDIWYPSTGRILPEYSDQVSAALHWDLGGKFLLTDEVYYKRLYRVVDFRTGAQLFANSRLEDEFVTGNGSAYGNEIYLEKTAGRLRGWVGYTLAWTWREFAGIDNGKRFFPRYDRRHDFSAVLLYQLRPRLSLSATWVYNTGNAVSLATGRYLTGDNAYVKINDLSAQIVPEYPRRNNYRMPAYHRLDLGVVYKFRPRRGERDLTVSVTNAYNRLNPYLITYQTQSDAEGRPTGFRARAVTLFPILPSVTYNFRF